MTIIMRLRKFGGRMRCLYERFVLLLGSCFLIASGGYAEGLDTFFDVDVGYRTDSLQFQDQVYIPPDALNTERRGLSSAQFVVLGASGQLAHSNFLLKGKGYFGWIADARLKDVGIPGSVSNGNVGEVSIGAGLYIDPDPFYSLTLAGGWSYDRLRFWAAPNVVDFPFYNRQRTYYESELHGPWAGLGLVYHPCDRTSLTFNYELHYASWKADVPYVAYPFRSDMFCNNIWGHVFEFDASWVVGVCTRVGFNLQWRAFQQTTGASSGSDSPYFDVPSSDTSMVFVNWQSFIVSLHAGYEF